MVKRVDKMTACNERAMLSKSTAEQVNILQGKCTWEHRSKKVTKWNNFKILLKKFVKMMEKVR
jgi:hypothetical protein